MLKVCISVILISCCLLAYLNRGTMDHFEKTVNSYLSSANDFDFDNDGATEEDKEGNKGQKASSYSDFLYIQKNCHSLACALVFLRALYFPPITFFESGHVKEFFYPPER